MDILSGQHFLQNLLFPPINGIWVLFLAVVKLRSRRFITSCVLFAIMVVYIQCTPLFAAGLSKLIYPKFDQVISNDKFKPQAIVVLGAGVEIRPGLIGGLRAFPGGVSVLNVESAAQIASVYPGLPIILSGGGNSDLQYSEAKAMSDYLKERYSLLNSEILEDRSVNTDENARYTAIKLSSRKINHVILVTQASHMWRSQALFAKYGIKTEAYPASDEYNISKLSWLQSILPNKQAMNQTRLILHEIIGYVVYVIV